MKENRTKKRDAPISIRLSKEELEEIDRRAERAGQSRSAFIKYVILSQNPPRQSRRSSIDEKLAAKFVAQASKITDRLDNIPGAHSDAERCNERRNLAYDAIIEMRNAFFKATGRKP